MGLRVDWRSIRSKEKAGLNGNIQMEEIFTNNSSDQKFISRIHKEPMKLNIKETSQLVTK